MKTMKLWRIAFMMLAAFSLASCKPSARQTLVDAGQSTDSTEAVTDGHWQQVPFPKDFGFASVLSTVAAHGSATVYGHIGLLHLTPGHYRLTKQIDGHTLSDDFYIPSTITFPTPVYR